MRSQDRARVPQDMRDEVGPGGHGKVLPQRPVEEADGGGAAYLRGELGRIDDG